MRCRACDGGADLAFEKDGDACFVCRSCGAMSRTVAHDLGERYADYLPPETLTLPPATRVRYREMLDRLAPRAGGGRRLLDVGAGAGLFVEVAREAGWDAEGTELSRAAADAARERGIVVHVGDLADLPLRRDSYDAVVSLECLEHVPSPPAFLRAAADLLRPGGVLFLTTPNWGSLSRRLLGKEWVAVSKDHLCLLTPSSLRRTLAAAGLAPDRVVTRTILPNEILKRFRRTPARRQGFAVRETAALQRSFEERPALARAKRVVNGLLGLTGLGDVLTATAVKRDP